MHTQEQIFPMFPVVLVDNGVSAIAGVRLDLYDAEDEPGEPKKDEEGMIAL
nr:MAG TPA: hypothetical protein [Caudoviricetes sp.]